MFHIVAISNTFGDRRRVNDQGLRKVNIVVCS